MIALEVEDLAQLAGFDVAPQRLHRGPQPAVVADAQLHARGPARLDHAPRVIEREGERLLAEHMLAGGRGGDHLREMRGVRRGEDDGLHGGIAEDHGVIGVHREAVGRRELARGFQRGVHRPHEAQSRALALHGLDQAAAPSAESDDGGIDHRHGCIERVVTGP